MIAAFDLLVKDTAQRLAKADELAWSEQEKAPLRALRNALILDGYTQGRTLNEMGEYFGLTRERARQVINKLVGGKAVNRLPTRYRRSEKARQIARQRGLQERATGERQKFRERNEKIAYLVEQGYSYAQVASFVGVSRNVVCTVMYRRNHRSDLLDENRKYPSVKASSANLPQSVI